MMTKDYSLWLCPKGEFNEKLKDIVKTLAKKHKSVTFTPHITLLGEIPMDEEQMLLRANQLSQLMKRMTLKISSIHTGQEYFRCVFARLEENDLLNKANDIARRFFYMEDDRDFMPHISLLYGDIIEDAKEEAASQIGLKGSFVIDELLVVHTEGYPKDWKVVKAFP